MKKSLIVGLVLPLVSELCLTPAMAVSYVGAGVSRARPAATSRMPGLGGTLVSTVRTVSTASVDAGLLATCAAPLRDRYTTSNCVRNYESCLREFDVCGEHFQLCSTQKEFNKKRILCQDTLARCPADGISALYGNSVTTSDDSAVANREICEEGSVVIKRSFSPALQDIAIKADSPIALFIKEGNAWAATNSVTTCNAVADDCIRDACAASPHKCLATDSFTANDANEMVNISMTSETSIRLNVEIITNYMNNMGWGASNVNAYLREQCRETVGANEWCYMVTNGKAAKDADLIDRDSISEVYRDIMESGTGARIRMSQSKIKEWTAQAAQAAVEACKSTMEDCAVNACGEGSRARCYGLAKNSSTGAVDIKGRAGTGITNMCKTMVENDQNCRDVFVGKNGKPSDAWDVMWTKDSIGAIAKLSTDLSTSFNEQAIADMRKNCQTQVEKCVTDECGTDFSSCFISSVEAGISASKSIINGAVTGTAFSGGFDKNMARDLCILKVKKYADCNDYFDVQYAKLESGASADSWGLDNSARNAWMNQSSTEFVRQTCSPAENYLSQIDADGNVIGTVDLMGNALSVSRTAATVVKTCAQQELGIFDNLLTDIGLRAQSVLERKANDAKNACNAKNPAGTKTYTWAQLPSLSAENESYGIMTLTPSKPVVGGFEGFCEAEINTSVDDLIFDVTDNKGNTKPVNVELANIAVCKRPYYAAVGSTQTCFVSKECLDEIDSRITAASKVCEKNKETGCLNILGWGQRNSGAAGLLAGLGGAIAGGGGGYLLGNMIDNKQQTKSESAENAEIKKCIDYATERKRELESCRSSASFIFDKSSAYDGCTAKVNGKNVPGGNVKSYTCSSATGEESDTGDIDSAITELNNAILSLNNAKTTATKQATGRIAMSTVLGSVVGIATGVGVGEGLKQSKNKAIQEVLSSGDSAWLTGKQKLIKCRNGGQSYDYLSEFIVR